VVAAQKRDNWRSQTPCGKKRAKMEDSLIQKKREVPPRGKGEGEDLSKGAALGWGGTE